MAQFQDFDVEIQDINTTNSPQKIIGGTDNTYVGNIGDRLKVDATFSSTPTIIQNPSNILIQAELTITTKNETDLGTIYTVPTGKSFAITSFMASYDWQLPIVVRLKKQTGGTGNYNQLFRINIKTQPNEASVVPMVFENSIIIGTAGDKFKMTVEASNVKGTVWGMFAGIEY